MKIGDILICKKPFRTVNGVYNSIGDIFNVAAIVSVNKGGNLVFVKEHYGTNSWDFYDYLTTSHTDYLWDHFYTPQEIRKMKLEKIYEK